MRFYYKAKNKKIENAKNAKDNNKFAFATQHGAHSRSICKWIMDLGATKHMTSYRAAFNTYEVISLRNVYLDNDNVAKAMGMGFIIVGVETRDKMNRICITDVLHVLKLQANLLSVSKF